MSHNPFNDPETQYVAESAMTSKSTLQEMVEFVKAFKIKTDKMFVLNGAEERALDGIADYLSQQQSAERDHEARVEQAVEYTRKLVVEYIQGMGAEGRKLDVDAQIAVDELSLPNDPNAQGTRLVLEPLREHLRKHFPSPSAKGESR